MLDPADPVIDLTAVPLSRLERDSLGPRAVPVGARYGIHTVRAVEAMGVSGHRLGDDPDLTSALGAVKQAAARANGDAGALSTTAARAIDQAAALLTTNDPEVEVDLPADLLGGGGSIAVNMNVNEVVANMANLSLGRPFGAYDPITAKAHVGASQSTADVWHTASRLAISAVLARLDRTLATLGATLDAKVRAFDGIETLARTCLRDATVTSAGLVFEGSAAALARRRLALQHATDPLLAVTLGATVIGDGAGAPERYRDRVVPHLCEVSGRNLQLHPQRASALQHSDDLVAVASELDAIAQVAAKLAQDIRLLSSGPGGGFGELDVSAVIEGSSFFAGTCNPVVAETVINVSLQITGHDAAVRAAASRAELHLQVFDNVAVVNVLDAARLLDAALDRFDRACVRGLDVDRERCRELASLVAPTTAPASISDERAE